MQLLDGLIAAVVVLVAVLLMLPKNRAAGVMLVTLAGVGFTLLMLPDLRTALASVQVSSLPSMEIAPVLVVAVLVAGVMLASTLASKDRNNGR